MHEDESGETMDDTGAATVGPGRPASGLTTRPLAGATVRSSATVQLSDTVRDVLRERAASPTAPAPGERYEEMRELGRGGMGRVVEARDRWLGRRVAQKHLLGSGKDAGLRRRFEVEALVTAQLDHPGIPTVYERSPDDGGPPSYTMRLVEGRPLSQLLREAPTFQARMALLPVVARVAQTLAFAHERGVVHRDVKPDNVVVGTHGDAVLLDWGIAKVRGLHEASPGHDDDAAPAVMADAHATAHGSVLGTPAYMAPEQARGEVAAVDERSDVFALGAMLFHVVAGHAPYRGASVTDVLKQAREAQPVDVDRLAAAAPGALRAIVKKAMAPDPAQRYTSAGEFSAALESFTTQALVRPVSKGVERFIASTSWFGLVLCLIGAAGGWAMTPTFREMGGASYIVLALFVVGMAVGVVEWQTRGRHVLMPLGLALVGLTASSAVTNAVMGLLMVYKHLNGSEKLQDVRAFLGVSAEGHYEALGNVPFGLGFAMLQAMVLAFAWRRARLSEATRQAGS